MIRRVVTALAVCLLVVVPATAQTVDEIVARNIEAKGGLTRLQAVQTVRMRVTTGVAFGGPPSVLGDVDRRDAQSGMRATPTMQGMIQTIFEAKRPNLWCSTSRLTTNQTPQTDSPNLNVTTIVGSDGTTTWRFISEQGRVETMPNPDPSPAFGFEGPLVDYQAKGYRVELDGKAKADGKDCYKLRVTSKNGGVLTVYIDATSCLDVMIDTKTKTTPVTVRQVFRDWKTVDGVLVAHTTLTTMGSFPSQRTTIDKVEFNVPIDDSHFARPAAIK
jgi:outer membrane lipoprotein-sorting protein